MSKCSLYSTEKKSSRPSESAFMALNGALKAYPRFGGKGYAEYPRTQRPTMQGRGDMLRNTRSLQQSQFSFLRIFGFLSDVDQFE